MLNSGERRSDADAENEGVMYDGVSDEHLIRLVHRIQQPLVLLVGSYHTKCHK